MGSKVPPKIPTFKMCTSPEIERRLADPDLVARLCAGAPQGAHDAPSLELPLEARHAFGILPVRLEGEPLHALAGDHVGAVLALHAHALPRRAEHAMLAGALLDICCVLRCLAQPLIQEVLELDYALASHCGDLDRALERFSQVPSKLLVQEVNLVQDGHSRLSGEPGGVQLRPEDPRRPFRVLARVQNQRQEPRARHMPQEPVAQTPACARPRDEPGDVRDHERFPVGLLVHHPELRRERGERVVAYPGTGGAQSREQRRLAGVGQPHEPDVREHLELQAYLLLLARQTPLAEGGRLAGRGSEGCVPSPALATTGNHERLLGLGEVGEQAALVVDLGTDWNFEDRLPSAFAGAVVARAVRAAAGLHDFAVDLGFEGGEVFGGAQDHRSTVAAAAAVRAAARFVLLAVKRDAAVATAPCADDEACFIYELQRG